MGRWTPCCSKNGWMSLERHVLEHVLGQSLPLFTFLIVFPFFSFRALLWVHIIWQSLPFFTFWIVFLFQRWSLLYSVHCPPRAWPMVTDQSLPFPFHALPPPCPPCPLCHLVCCLTLHILSREGIELLFFFTTCPLAHRMYPPLQPSISQGSCKVIGSRIYVFHS